MEGTGVIDGLDAAALALLVSFRGDSEKLGSVAGVPGVTLRVILVSDFLSYFPPESSPVSVEVPSLVVVALLPSGALSPQWSLPLSPLVLDMARHVEVALSSVLPSLQMGGNRSPSAQVAFVMSWREQRCSPLLLPSWVVLEVRALVLAALRPSFGTDLGGDSTFSVFTGSIGTASDGSDWLSVPCSGRVLDPDALDIIPGRAVGGAAVFASGPITIDAKRSVTGPTGSFLVGTGGDGVREDGLPLQKSSSQISLAVIGVLLLSLDGLVGVGAVTVGVDRSMVVPAWFARAGTDVASSREVIARAPLVGIPLACAPGRCPRSAGCSDSSRGDSSRNSSSMRGSCGTCGGSSTSSTPTFSR